MSRIIDVSSFNIEQLQQLAGVNDIYYQTIEKHYHVNIMQRNGLLEIKGDNKEDVDKAYNVINRMVEEIKAKINIDLNTVQFEINNKSDISYQDLNNIIVAHSVSGKVIKPKTIGQYNFVKLMNDKTITFALGPAGTGKTYLAVCQAVSALKKNEIEKIVLTRPAVEAGESLGFLPGDLKEKVDPYLTPLYDCLNEMLGFEQVEKYIEKNIIEIAPLAYMRGRTLNKAYVILDEAQNTTVNQMKMFLTRLGFQSKMIITGDPSQIDLNKNIKSGLFDAVEKLNDIEEIGIITLQASDVVRNPLVAKIINAYQD